MPPWSSWPGAPTCCSRRRRSSSGPDNPRGLHLTGRQAAEAGAAAGVGTVLLTHIPPWHDPDQVLAEATPHFDGPVSLAVTGGSLAT